MLISEYFQEIEYLIKSCNFAQSYDIFVQERSIYQGFIRSDIVFQNNSFLHLREFVNVKTEINMIKYSYQYMDNAKNLVFRYDNAPHHQKLNLSTYPHHKHDGSEANIIAANKQNLADVLREIESFL